MIKVLIVDDEVLVRIGIKSCIKWENSGFEIVGEAENGIEALELAEIYKPDLVLTDIRMPKMDGLEFLRHLKEKQPDVKTIILSCYNEFSYVREAMKLGALDYVLKLSMQPEELLEILNRIKGVIDKEKKQYSEVYLLRQKANSNIKTIKEDFIKNALAGNIKNESEFYLNIHELEFKIDFSSYMVIHISIEDYRFIASTRWENDEQSLNSSVSTVISNILTKYGESEVIQYEGSNFYVILSPTGNFDQGNTCDAVLQLAENIVEMITTYLNMKVSLGISSSGRTLEELNKKVMEAQLANSYGFYLKKKNISFYNEYIKFDSNTLPDFSSVEPDLLHALDVVDKEKIKVCIAWIFQKIIEDKNVYPDKFIKKLTEILYLFSRRLNAIEGTMDEIIDEYETGPYERVGMFLNIYNLEEWFDKFIDRYSEYVKLKQKKKTKEEIIKIKNYVLTNYTGKFSISICARICNMSEKYFSYVFKKETGENFTNYVNKVRIEKAKELIKNQNMVIFEVANKVGYENDKYFIKLFRKIVGMTPGEYKRKYYTSF